MFISHERLLFWNLALLLVAGMIGATSEAVSSERSNATSKLNTDDEHANTSDNSDKSWKENSLQDMAEAMGEGHGFVMMRMLAMRLRVVHIMGWLSVMHVTRVSWLTVASLALALERKSVGDLESSDFGRDDKRTEASKDQML